MGQGGSRTGKEVIPGNKDKEGRTRKKVSCGKHGACRQEKLGEVSWCHIILTTAGHVEVLDFVLCFGEVLVKGFKREQSYPNNMVKRLFW